MFRAHVFALTAMFCAAALAAGPQPVVSYSKKAKFEDVRDDLRPPSKAKAW